MNNLLRESVVPSALSAAEIIAEQKTIIKAEDEIGLTVRDVSFKKNNRLMADGRIFGGYDAEGRYYAVSVSPFFDEFDTQIEDGILPVVAALRQKGYLTCSSCYGHPSRAMVVLCFPDDEEREKFSRVVSEAEIPTMDIQFRKTMVNVSVQQDRNGNVMFSGDLEFDHDIKTHKEMEIKSFNDMFFRSYEQYSFLHITLVNEYNPLLHPIKAWNTRKYLPEKDHLLSQFTDLINSSKIPYFAH